MSMSIEEATWHEQERCGTIIINAGNESIEAKASQPTEALLIFIRGSIAITCIIVLSLFAILSCLWQVCASFYKLAVYWRKRIE